MPMMNEVGWSCTQASSRSLGVRSGQRSSNSWVVTKATSRSTTGRVVSWGNTERRVAWVSHRTPTMVDTVCFKYPTFRSLGAMTFSQSHWSTYTEWRLSSSSSRRMAFMSVYSPSPTENW